MVGDEKCSRLGTGLRLSSAFPTKPRSQSLILSKFLSHFSHQMTSILKTLQRVFGLQEFRPFQQEIIEQVLGGGDAFVLMPTGGGKSLCYQLPALHREGCFIET